MGGGEPAQPVMRAAGSSAAPAWAPRGSGVGAGAPAVVLAPLSQAVGDRGVAEVAAAELDPRPLDLRAQFDHVQKVAPSEVVDGQRRK